MFDGGRGNDEDSGKAGFVKEPGIAQSVHWFRDRDAGLTEALMASLISSELQVNFDFCLFYFGTSSVSASERRLRTG